MLTLLGEIHFWSRHDSIVIKNTDYGAFKYSSKKDNSESAYLASKKSYCEKRGVTWTVLNKRPQKLKEKLKELEDYLLCNRIICFTWERSSVIFLLSKGIVVDITYNKSTSDVVSISFDKFLVSKIQNDVICDGVISGQHVVAVCTDGRVFGYGGSWKDCWTIEGGPRKYLYLQDELVVIWGRLGTEHPQPWSPLTKDHQRANLHLYWIGLRGPELISYKKTFAEPISVIISKIYSKNLIIVEQKVSQRGAVSVEVSVLELINNSLKRAAVTAVPLQTQISCCSLSLNENFLLLGCIDGSVALLDRNRGSTKIVKASFIPTFAAWHDCNCLAIIANEKGQIQYIDVALNFLKCQVSSEDCTPNAIIDISSYFNTQANIVSVTWGPRHVLIASEHGPLAVFTHVEQSLTFTSLVQRYIVDGKIHNAISLLLTWEFNEDCFGALQRICAYLMRLPLTDDNAKLLQNALGSYYSSAVPLNVDVMHPFGFQVKALTRRFFHQLVRTSMFETAFLLAVDIGHHDLFMDLHYIAIRIGETEMAAAARAQASTLLSRCSSAASDCSRSSCSQCSETSSSSDDLDSPERHHSEQKTHDRSNQTFNDNYLTTNFNNMNPKTYSSSVPSSGSYVPPIPNIDLPKVNFSKTVFSKPQVLGSSRSMCSTASVPPLPITPPRPVPTLATHQYVQARHQPSLTYSVPSPSYIHLPPRPLLPTFNNSNPRPVPPKIFNAFSPINTTTSSKPVVAPPLPIPPPPLPDPSLNTAIPSSSIFDNLSNNPVPVITGIASSTSNLQAQTTKKAQAKVKFSDTVTAFIVPEIKRPVRPTLPAHVMDPQKELADSLPLCHPNEDYLKDFAPVKRNETNETPTPKIKVVHFGVV